MQGGVLNVLGKDGMNHSTAERRIIPVHTSNAQQRLLLARTVLVVEAPAVLPLLDGDGIRRTVVASRMANLGAELLDRVAPQAVVGPLIARDWDILDLALLLAGLRYGGALYACTRPLPRSGLVLDELRASCPGLEIVLLEIG